MNNPQEKSENTAFDLFEKLPESLQKTIKSNAANERISQIAQKYEIEGNDLFELPMIAGQYILGVIAPDELVPTLVEDLGIGISKANEIAEDLYTNIFSEIGPDFQKHHGYPARPKLLVLTHKEDAPVQEIVEPVADHKDAIKTPKTFSEEVGAAKKESDQDRMKPEEKVVTIQEPQNAPEVPAEDWGKSAKEIAVTKDAAEGIPGFVVSDEEEIVINGEEQEIAPEAEDSPEPEEDVSPEIMVSADKEPPTTPQAQEVTEGESTPTKELSGFEEINADKAGIKLSAVPPGKKIALEDLPRIKIVSGKRAKKQKPTPQKKAVTPPPSPIITPEPNENPVISTARPEPTETTVAPETTKAPHDYKQGSDPYREIVE